MNRLQNVCSTWRIEAKLRRLCDSDFYVYFDFVMSLSRRTCLKISLSVVSKWTVNVEIFVSLIALTWLCFLLNVLCPELWSSLWFGGLCLKPIQHHCQSCVVRPAVGGTLKKIQELTASNLSRSQAFFTTAIIIAVSTAFLSLPP